MNFQTPEQVTKVVHTERAVRDWRKLRRDLLFIRYGETWAEHDPRSGQFWDEVSDEEKAEMASLMRLSVEGAK